MVKSSAGDFPIAARLISVSKRRWGRNPPGNPKELASQLLDGDFEYTFTGRLRHLYKLKKGRVLVFRFMKTIVGEARFDRWLEHDTMYCKNGKAYPNLLPSRGYIPKSSNPYEWLSESVLSDIRADANRYDTGSYVRTEEAESPTTHRIGQGEIRARALVRYGGKCALCHVDSAPLLVAGHIRGWAKGKRTRGSDDNVILLCSMHDTLFGKGYITLDYPSYRVRYCRSALSDVAFKQLKSVALEFARPSKKGAPARTHLQWHKNNIFGRPLKNL